MTTLWGSPYSQMKLALNLLHPLHVENPRDTAQRLGQLGQVAHVDGLDDEFDHRVPLRSRV